ncbi:hypothetical protein Nhal_3412 [Nitrosococcus halophilus Nc 4]|uniref:Uncharacterized protein n=1 Tax=Nitrosococcus halophilus (strain Nc4) TaxID=472759 RepID=D5C189_NITHN|nr:hypothetical protein Nhal_3412 [Nitrosococcus halophilus Nc 4]
MEQSKERKTNSSLLNFVLIVFYVVLALNLIGLGSS